jgi:hypothetical protein
VAGPAEMGSDRVGHGLPGRDSENLMRTSLQMDRLGGATSPDLSKFASPLGVVLPGREFEVRLGGMITNGLRALSVQYSTAVPTSIAVETRI